ncbi:hypothetical protein Tco_0906235, partial [Tanacetum coccineum]
TEQVDSAVGGPDANIQLVVEAADTVAEDTTFVQSRRQGKRKSVVVDAGGVSHPPKKLRGDHETPSGASIGVRVAAIPTLPFVTTSISTTPEREDGDHTDSVVELNLCTIRAPQRFVISSDSTHHSGTKVAEAKVDSLIRSSIPIMTTVTTTTSTIDPTLVNKEKFVEPYPLGAGSSSTGRTDPITGVFSDLTGSDFLVGAIRTVINLDTDLQKVYVPQWGVMNGSRLDDSHVYREMVDEFAPPKFFASVRRMEHEQLFTKFNVRGAHQMSLSAKVRMRPEYNLKEKRRLKSVVKSHGKLLKGREEDIESLKAWLFLREAEAAKAIRLRAEASNIENVEKSLRAETNALREHNVILEKKQNTLDVKVTELETSVVSKERELTDLNALIHELEMSFGILEEKVTVYENCMEQLE